MANKIPTLIVGIGGIGSRIVRTVRSSLNDKDMETIATVCLDTDTAILEDLKKAGVDQVIQTSSDEVAGVFARRLEETHPETRGWMHNNSYMNAKSLTEGAGQIRQLSRLAMLASIEDNKFNAINDAINKINSAGSTFDQSMKVFIVGSIAGGTGAGLMVQLPLYIKSKILSMTKRGNVLVRGVFIGPTITEEKQNNDQEKITATYGNAYACVKEVNALNVFASRNKFDIPIKIDFYEPKRDSGNREVNPIPYDFLFLLDQRNYKGGVLSVDAHLEDYIKMAADILRAQLTSVGVNLFSAEDNLIRPLIKSGGLNRFCGAGTVDMVYPVEKIADYCAYRMASDSISTEWLKLDNEYNLEKQRNAMAIANDPSFSPKTSKEGFYTNMFSKLSSPESADIFYKVLGGEMSPEGVVNADEDSLYAEIDESILNDLAADDDMKSDRFTDLLASIDNHIAECAEDEKLMERKDACTVTSASIVNAHEYEQSTIVEDRLKAIKSYGKAVRNNQQKCISVADDIIPVMSDYGDFGYNVISVIKKTHPIVSRHILMNLKIELGRKLGLARNAEKIHKEGLDYIESVDFDEEAAGVQSAVEVFSNLMNADQGGGLFSFIKIGKAKNSPVEEFASKFARAYNVQVQTWTDYNMAAFQARVFAELIRRIDILLEVYQVFFDSLPASIRDLNARVESAEIEHEVMNESTERYVFARSHCKRAAYKMVSDRVQDISLPDSTKRVFTERLHNYFISYYKDTMNKGEEVVRALKETLVRNTKMLFEETILDSMRKEIYRIAANDLNIGVIKALEYEILLDIELEDAAKEADGTTIGSSANTEDIAMMRFRMKIDPTLTPDYSSARLDNMRKDIFRKVASKATPFIGLKGDPDDESITWATCEAALDKYTPKMLSSIVDVDPAQTPTLILDDDFTKNELLCYRAAYGIMPELLSNYNETSKAREEYDKLIDAMNSEAIAYGGSMVMADEENQISPHIDKRWHYEAFLPQLGTDAEKQERFNDFLALIGLFGIVSQEMIRIEDKYGKKRWLYMYHNSPYELFCDDRHAAVSYPGIYESMKYNKPVKKDISRLLEKLTERDIRDTVDIEAEIMDHEVIKALFSCHDIFSEDGSVMTALDMLNILSPVMGETLVRDTVAGLSRFIWSYCTRACRYEQNVAVYDSLIDKLIAASRPESVKIPEISKMKSIHE